MTTKVRLTFILGTHNPLCGNERIKQFTGVFWSMDAARFAWLRSKFAHYEGEILNVFSCGW